MGIKGQWELINELIPLQTTTLAEESKKHFGRTGIPLRVAVDASIVIWKIMTGASAKAIESKKPAEKAGLAYRFQTA